MYGMRRCTRHQGVRLVAEVQSRAANATTEGDHGVTTPAEWMVALGMVGTDEKFSIPVRDASDPATMFGVDMNDESSVGGSKLDDIRFVHGNIVARTIGSCGHWCKE